FSSRRRHTRFSRDWSSDVCSSDLAIAVLNGTANAILRAMGIEPKEEISAARTAEELRSLVRRSASEGSLDADTATLLARTLVFRDRKSVVVGKRGRAPGSP